SPRHPRPAGRGSPCWYSNSRAHGHREHLAEGDVSHASHSFLGCKFIQTNPVTFHGFPGCTRCADIERSSVHRWKEVLPPNGQTDGPPSEREGGEGAAILSTAAKQAPSCRGMISQNTPRQRPRHVEAEPALPRPDRRRRRRDGLQPHAAAHPQT